MPTSVSVVLSSETLSIRNEKKESTFHEEIVCFWRNVGKEFRELRVAASASCVVAVEVLTVAPIESKTTLRLSTTINEGISSLASEFRT